MFTILLIGRLIENYFETDKVHCVIRCDSSLFYPPNSDFMTLKGVLSHSPHGSLFSVNGPQLAIRRGVIITTRVLL